MLGYFDVFPEKRETELRTATFPDDDLNFPRGTYVFTEYYCPDPDCDCNRLLVKVFHVASPNGRPAEVATISYTWDKNSWADILSDTNNPFLDPFHYQAPFARDLMEFWHDMTTRDTAYANRLKRHYVELRGQHGKLPAINHLMGRVDFPRPEQVDKSVIKHRRRAERMQRARLKRARKKSR